MEHRRLRSIYLAGPISGLGYDEARFGWRDKFRNLVPENLQCYSPMRAKEFLADVDQIEGAYDYNPMATEAGIIARDHNDVLNCDAMVACFLEDNGRASLGTAVEYGWAHAYRKPIITVATKDDIHTVHPMLSRLSGYIVEDLETAARIVTHLLTPGV